MQPYLKLDHIDKTFSRGSATTEVLKDINLTIERGEYVSIIGHSGCGKSTLLNIVAAEMLIGGVGIGFFIWDAWNSSHISEIILALFYVGIIGFVLDRLIAGLGKVVTRGTSAS